MSKYRQSATGVSSNTAVKAVTAVQDTLRRMGSTDFVRKGALAMETWDDTTRQEVTSSVQRLRTTLESLDANYTSAQTEAAEIAAVAAADPVAAMSTKVSPATDSVFHTDESGVEAVGLEEYDETQNRNVTTHAVVYNLEASRQDEFGEAWYPTVTVAPDEPGYRVEIELVGIFDSIRRDTTGNADNWERRNVLFGLRDPEILKNNETEIIPVHRVASASKFVDTALLPTWSATQGKETFQTSALKFDETINLLSISQTDALLATGASDSQDTLDTAVVLKDLYLQVTKPAAGGDPAVNEVIKFDVSALPTSVFVNDQQSNQRGMVVNFTTKDLQINKNVKTVGGSASVVLASVISGGWEVRLTVDVNGRVGLWNGEIRLSETGIRVDRILNASGQVYAASQIGVGHPAKAILDLFTDAKLVGWFVSSRRQNHGRRQLGRLVDSQKFAEAFEVPLLSPIATVRPPQNANNEETASAIARLVQITNVMASNAAVDALFTYSSTLAQYVSLQSTGVEGPALRNVARYLVTPVHKQTVLDVTDFTDSVRSQDRAADIRAGLINVLRNDVWAAYRDSNLAAARQGVNGQSAGLPTVLLGADMVLANWLMFDGELRTLGGEFKLRVVTTPNKRMTGKIFVTFLDEQAASSGKPYPLGFGNMAWKVQVPLILQTQRNGATNRELSVQPSFRHFNNLPVLLDYTVTGMSELVNARLGLVAVTTP